MDKFKAFYALCEADPNSSIAAMASRLEFAFDYYDDIVISFSGGKDSTLSFHAAAAEVAKRRFRVSSGVGRDGSPGIDPRDQRWVDRKFYVNVMHPEWIYSDTQSHQESLMSEYLTYANPFYKCLQLGWTSSVTFGDDRITSWDPEKSDAWIHDLPSKSKLGFDPVTNENIKVANPVAISSLPDDIARKRLSENDWFYGPDGEKLAANWGYGSADYFDYDAWTFPGQDEDHEQESFAKWMSQQLPYGSKICNVVSIRAEESYDRWAILRQSNYETGIYSKEYYLPNGMKDAQKSEKSSRVDLCAPSMEMSVSDVWKIFYATQWEYSNLYDLMWEAGIPPASQRTASLLNMYASKSIADIKSFEPKLYIKIASRFQNIEMVSSFARNGYFNIGKPKSQLWNGKNHIMDGDTKDKMKMVSDHLEALMMYKNIPYERVGNEFQMNDDEMKRIHDCIPRISYTWENYFGYLIKTSSEPYRSRWKNKIITATLSQRFQGESLSPACVDSLIIMTELGPSITSSIIGETWTSSDWCTHGSLKSGLIITTISKPPNESLTSLMQSIISADISGSMNLRSRSRRLDELYRSWENGEIFSWSEIISGSKRSRWKSYEKSTRSWENGSKCYFREDIKSSFSWKRACIMILKNDVIGKYLGFTATYRERTSRRKI